MEWVNYQTIKQSVICLNYSSDTICHAVKKLCKTNYSWMKSETGIRFYIIVIFVCYDDELCIETMTRCK